MSKPKGYVFKGWVNIYHKDDDFVTDGKLYLTQQIAKDNKDPLMKYVVSKKIMWVY